MRIGIYAPNLATPAPSGVERYITELLRALSTTPSSHELALITDAQDLPLPPGGRRVPLRPMGRLSRLRFDHCRLAGLAREERLDVLHCTKSYVPKGLSCASLASVYDVIFLKRPECYPLGWRLYWTRALRASVDRASAVVAMSEATARDVESLLPEARGKVHAVRTGVNAASFALPKGDAETLRAKRGIRPPYLLYVGNITRRKNLPVLLDAYESVRSSLGAGLVLAGALEFGGGDVLERMRRGIEGVSYLGRVSDGELAALYQGALAFVYPSQDEGFGLPVLEAMASRVPVITTTGGALPEAVGDAGLLVNPGSVPELAQAMQRMAGDPALRESLVARGLARVAEHSWSRTAQQTLDLYEKTAARR
jgi:glycosyltransferase involved in cell wall biosynthesis